MMPLGSKLAPPRGSQVGTIGTKKARINSVGKMTQVNNPGHHGPLVNIIFLFAVELGEPIIEMGSKGLPNDKILDWSKFKALAEDKINVEKKKMLVTSIFSFSQNVFKSLLSQGR